VNSDNVAFVRHTVERALLPHQTLRLGGKADGALCFTVVNFSEIGYLSLGSKDKDTGKWQRVWCRPAPFELQPRRLNYALWPVLDRLSELTGDSKYRDLTAAMAGAFARHGFDPASGLPFIGEESDFDVLACTGMQTGSRTKVRFKSGNLINGTMMPLVHLWQHAPQQSARAWKAAFYGLISDPVKFDYNRFCSYGFDDRARTHILKPYSGFNAFSSAGTGLIHLWASHFAHTGDRETLAWAQGMADKWQAAQHPESGLMPERFGGYFEGIHGDRVTMPPSEWHETHDGAQTVVNLLAAADELASRPEAASLADQLKRMAHNQARGLARFAFDQSARLFHEHLWLDGRVYQQSAAYCFATQQEKDAEVANDPELADVAVYRGLGFYEPGPYWSPCASCEVPAAVALAAHRTGDDELLRRAGHWADLIMDEAGKPQSAFTPAGKWSFPATAAHIEMFLSLWKATRQERHLNRAQALAEMEIHHLCGV
jgi:hypothetical protein